MLSSGFFVVVKFVIHTCNVQNVQLLQYYVQHQMVFKTIITKVLVIPL